MKIIPNTTIKINVELTDNRYFDARSRLGNDIENRIKNKFIWAYACDLVPINLERVEVNIPTDKDQKPIIKLIPQSLQKYLKITWIKL